MNITWDNVDRTETPRWVTVEGKRFEVKQLHIDAWKHDPDGAWSLTQPHHIRALAIGHHPRSPYWACSPHGRPSAGLDLWRPRVQGLRICMPLTGSRRQGNGRKP